MIVINNENNESELNSNNSNIYSAQLCLLSGVVFYVDVGTMSPDRAKSYLEAGRKMPGVTIVGVK